MHPLVRHPLPGTRLPVSILEGRPVPVPGARWTLVVLGDAEEPVLGRLRPNLTAEGVAAVVVPAPAVRGATGAVLLDALGVVQHAGGSVRDALDAVRAFREGRRVPVAFADSRPAEACPDAGRRRRAGLGTWARRRRAA